jgi:hypothetical protein
MYKQSTKANGGDCLVVKSSPIQVNPKFVPVGYSDAVLGSVRTTFTAKAQEDVFLKYFYLSSANDGVINDIRIGNQSLNCSDSAIDACLFGLQPLGLQRKPFIGVAVDGNIQMSVDVTFDGGAPNNVFQGAFSCEAVEKAPTLQAQGQALNKFFGLGTVVVPAGGSATLSAQALRDCFLKDMVLRSHGTTAFGLVVTDITIKGRSILSGQASDAIDFRLFSPELSATLEGINVAIETNQRVQVTVLNTTGTSVLVGGGLYAE